MVNLFYVRPRFLQSVSFFFVGFLALLPHIAEVEEAIVI